MKDGYSISVIIAMYNAEKYIGECLASLANQTFQDFEIIVADDCSTDNSRAVVENFVAVFQDRLRMMTLSRNSGCPGIPRNFAIKAARGKYIYFLDGDDLLSETALEELYICAEKFKADVVHSEKCFAFLDGEEKSEAEIISHQAGEFVTEPMLETFDIGERVKGFIEKKFLWWACNKLLRRQFLIDNAIRFPEVHVFEDMIFAFKCVVTARNYVRVPFVSYYYRVRENSLSHVGRDAIDLSENMFKVVSELDNFMNSQKFFYEKPRYRYLIFDFFIQERLGIIASCLFTSENADPEVVFDYFRVKIFSINPAENVALTAYLFVVANIFKLYSQHQEDEIESLKKQIAALKK